MDAVEQAIAGHVARHASTWFPGVPAAPDVHLRTLSTRRRSRVYLVSAGPPPDAPLLVAKVRYPGTAASPGPSRRPALATGAADESELTRREHAGLQLIATAVPAGDHEHGVVEPLGLLPEHHTILMRYVPGEPVRDLLLQHSRLRTARHRIGPARTSPHDLDTVLLRVGSWLRRFHRAAAPDQLPARQASGEELVAAFGALEEFLGRRVGRRPADLAAAGAALAADVFPTGPLPLVVGHGDYAPRNILVDGTDRVVVVDPMVRWSVPEHEDLCRFLVGIRMLGLQLHTHGAAFGTTTVEHWEDRVLAGFHPEGAPLARLRCHQLLILLDKWSALLEPAGSGRLAVVHRLAQGAAVGWVSGQAGRLLDLARAADR